MTYRRKGEPQPHRFISDFLLLYILLFTLPRCFKLCSSMTIENGIVGDPMVDCGSASITFRVQTNTMFDGNLFVKNFFHDSKCTSRSRTTQNKTDHFQVQLTVFIDNCGIIRQRLANPVGITVQFTAIVMFHQQFLTKVDRSYQVSCFYVQTENTLSAALEVSMLTTAAVIMDKGHMPLCTYKVQKDITTEATVKYAVIGQKVYHKWSCRGPDISSYCMRVHSCTVDDGAGNKFLLLDELGCALDRYILPNVEYSTSFEALSAGHESHVFRFADKPQVYFNCQITLQVRNTSLCPQLQCREPTKGRRKRSEKFATEKLTATIGIANNQPQKSTKSIDKLTNHRYNDHRSIDFDWLKINQSQHVKLPEVISVEVSSDPMAVLDIDDNIEDFAAQKPIDYQLHTTETHNESAPNKNKLKSAEEASCVQFSIFLPVVLTLVFSVLASMTALMFTCKNRGNCCS